MPRNAETLPFKPIAENTISPYVYVIIRTALMLFRDSLPEGNEVPEIDRAHHHQC